MDKIKQFVASFVQNILTGLDGHIESAVKTLLIDVQTDPMMSPVYNTLHTLSQQYIVPIAVNIVLIVFMVEFIQLSIKTETLKIEFLFKAMLKFLIVKYALDISFDVILEIYQGVTSVVANIMSNDKTIGNIEFGAKIGVQISGAMEKMTWYESIGFLGTMAITFIGIFAAGFIVRVMAYVRTFDILLGMTFFSLPCAFLGLTNSRIAKNFFFEFIGTCLQGLVIIVSIVMYGAVANSIVANFANRGIDNGNIAERMATMMTFSGEMLLAVLVLLVMIVKSGSFAKSILRES